MMCPASWATTGAALEGSRARLRWKPSQRRSFEPASSPLMKSQSQAVAFPATIPVDARERDFDMEVAADGLFDDRWKLAVAVEPVAVGANAVLTRPGGLPEVRRQLVLVERQRRPLLRADDDPPPSGEGVAEFHHAVGADAGEIDHDDSSAVQSLEDLDVHEGPLRVPAPHLPRREATLFSHRIDDVAEEALDLRVVRMVRGEQTNVEGRRRAQIGQDLHYLLGQRGSIGIRPQAQ